MCAQFGTSINCGDSCRSWTLHAWTRSTMWYRPDCASWFANFYVEMLNCTVQWRLWPILLKVCWQWRNGWCSTQIYGIPMASQAPIMFSSCSEHPSWKVFSSSEVQKGLTLASNMRPNESTFYEEALQLDRFLRKLLGAITHSIRFCSKRNHTSIHLHSWWSQSHQWKCAWDENYGKTLIWKAVTLRAEPRTSCRHLIKAEVRWTRSDIGNSQKKDVVSSKHGDHTSYSLCSLFKEPCHED